jgi:hypothetical protein
MPGFWGLTFGIPFQQALGLLTGSGKISRNNIAEQTANSIKLKNVLLDGIHYNQALLLFKNNVLASGYFLQSAVPAAVNLQNETTLVEQQTSLYGAPSISHEAGKTVYSWYDNSRQRSVRVEQSVEQTLSLFYVDLAISARG